MPDVTPPGREDKPSAPSRPSRPQKDKPGSIALYVILGVGLLLIGLNMLYSSRRGSDLSFGEFESGLESGKFSKENVYELTFSPDYIHFQSQPGDDPRALMVDGLGGPQAEPTKTEPAKTEPAQTEPAQAEPAKTDATPASTTAKTPELRRFRVPVYGIPDDSLHSLRVLLKDKGIDVAGSSPPGDWASLAYFIFLLSLVLVMLIVFRRMGGAGSAMCFGRSRGKLYADDDIGVTFHDAAGIDEAVEELQGSGRVPADAGEVSGARRAHSARCAAGRTAGNREDAAGQSGRR